MTQQTSHAEQPGMCPFCGAQVPHGVASSPTVGERAAIRIAKVVATWRFVGSVLAAVIAWIVLNLVIYPVQPFPVVMISGLAAGLGLLAALYGPIVLLTQRVEARRDRERAHATLDAVLDIERRHVTDNAPAPAEDSQQP